jgi:hypothetical protein
MKENSLLTKPSFISTIEERETERETAKSRRKRTKQEKHLLFFKRHSSEKLNRDHRHTAALDTSKNG